MKFVLATTAFAALAAAAPTSVVRRTDAPYGIKKGLAYNDGNAIKVLSQAGSATWAYNWGTALNAPAFQQIPMYWGLNQATAVSTTILSKIKNGDTPYVLGYNEPDETLANGGCNATPRQAYDAWGNNMFAFANKGAKLVCPAITSWDTTSGHTGGPAGFTWLRQFASINNNPSQFRCSAQALHWYGVNGQTGAAQGQLFIDYIANANIVVNDIYGFNMPLWITEFAPLPLHDTQILKDFLHVALPFLDSKDYVDRYSPFMAEDLVTNGALNIAGKTFVAGK